jgi:hypothetical protein
MWGAERAELGTMFGTNLSIRAKDVLGLSGRIRPRYYAAVFHHSSCVMASFLILY